MDIDRKTHHHVSFGYGVHQCLGQPLTRVEPQVVPGRMFSLLPTLRIAGATQDVPLRHDMLITAYTRCR